MTPTFALAIPHAAHLENRRQALARMLQELAPWFPDRPPASEPPQRLFVFQERTKSWCEWAEAIWAWAVGQPTTHVVFLNDDLRLAPGFWKKLSAMVRAVPDQVIGLAAVHPAARHLARVEKRRWYTSADHLIGPGWCAPTSLFQTFMAWREHQLRPAAKTKVSEDIQVNLWHIDQGRRIWHPLPTILDHELAQGSTYGNDGHLYRRTQVSWEDGDVCRFTLDDLEQPRFWFGEPAHVGRYFSNTPYLANEWLVDPNEDRIADALRDIAVPYLKFFHLGDPVAETHAGPYVPR
jgi:hypothetical protein